MDTRSTTSTSFFRKTEIVRAISVIFALFMFVLATWISLIVCYSDELAPTQASEYPDHIINGDFEYPGVAVGSHPHSTYISPLGYYLDCNAGGGWHPIPNWDFALYGWRSTQTSYGTDADWLKYTTGGSELQRDSHGNTIGEIVAGQSGKAIYQDIATTPNSIYKWSLDYQSHSANFLDKMSVMIGSTTSQTAQDAWRTTVNGLGNKTGYVGTVLSTPTTRTSGWDTLFAQSEHYEGVYVCPSEQYVTRFSFKSVASPSETAGNKVDNITFVIADPLHYDLNGGAGNLPIPQTSGTYPGYYQRGTSPTLSNIVPTRMGYTFIGWSAQKHDDIINKPIPSNIALIKQKKIEAGNNYVYAVWAKNPTITFKDSITGNTVSTVQLPYNTSVAASDIPSVPDHAGYRFTGYSTAPTSKFIQDTEIKLQYEPAGRIQVNVEWIDRNNLAGSRENLQLSIPQTADPSASHDITISKDADTVTIPFLPSVNDPKEEIALSAESKYDLTSVSISKTTDANGITTIIYNIAVKYIPISDLVITKLWDDDNDRYQERPNSIIVEIYCDDVELPADTDEEFSEDDYWRLYDTIVISQDPEDPDSDSWEAVVHDVPLWSSRGYSGDVLVDAHYKIKELPVQGYDFISCTGNVQDGFIIENKVFGHVSIPSTGSSSHMLVNALTLISVSITAAFVLISILRSCKSTRTFLSSLAVELTQHYNEDAR